MKAERRRVGQEARKGETTDRSEAKVIFLYPKRRLIQEIGSVHLHDSPPHCAYRRVLARSFQQMKVSCPFVMTPFGSFPTIGRVSVWARDSNGSLANESDPISGKIN